MQDNIIVELAFFLLHRCYLKFHSLASMSISLYHSLSLSLSLSLSTDGIDAELYKGTSHEIVPILTHMFNTILDKGEIPAPWNESIYICPIHKSCSFNPVPHIPILGFSNSAANRNMMSKIRSNGGIFI